MVLTFHEISKYYCCSSLSLSLCVSRTLFESSLPLPPSLFLSAHGPYPSPSPDVPDAAPESMFSANVFNTDKIKLSSSKYPKDPAHTFGYGTAGFRMKYGLAWELG